MASSIKVSGSWKRITGASVKVGSTWRTVNAAYVKVAGVWKQWFAAFITDNFNRSTSGSLGTSSSGATWVATQGNWYANGGQAQSDGAASTYPLASVGFGLANVSASADVVSGTGVAVWVSGGGSWWAATSYNNTSSYSYSCGCSTCCTYYGGGCLSCPNPTCGTYPSGLSCGVGGSGTVDGNPGPTGCTYEGQICYKTSLGNGLWGVYYCGMTYSLNSCASCEYCGTAPGYYGEPCVSCGCSICSGTNYNYYLRLLKSESGTVSTVTGDVSLGAQAAAIAVQTNGDTITAKAYSDTAMTTQIGSDLVYTATSPTKGLSVGIVKAPSDYNQGSTVDNFSVGL
jgi:hypothetical protein